MKQPSQINIETYIKENSGTININPRKEKSKPQESLGPASPIRWAPTALDDLKARARQEGVNFNKFIRKLSEIGNHYSLSEVDQLISDRALHRTVIQERNVFVALINALRKS